MRFGFRKKEEEVPFKTSITDKDEVEEIKKIADRLDQDETVVAVAKQSRIKPGGSIATPAIIFATDQRLIIKDPSALGLRESIDDISYGNITGVRLQKGVFSSSIMIKAPGISTLSEKSVLKRIAFAKGSSNEGEIDAIQKDKAEQLVEIIKKGMEKAQTSKSLGTSSVANQQQQVFSVADELAKIAKLKEQGIVTEAEFVQMKQELLHKI